MADVKWIKIVTDIFDDEKILLIESMPDADAIIVIWFKLLCLAGKQNNGGVFMLNDRIPYTEDMFATIFRRKKATISMALKIFEQFGMIEIINNTVTIPNWSKHQNLDTYERQKERDRLRKQKLRAEQKALIASKADTSADESVDTPTDMSTDMSMDVHPLDIEEDIDKNKNRDNIGADVAEAPSGRPRKGSKGPSFKPPALEDVQAYARENGYDNQEFDPEVFTTFYESKDWMVGGSKMKDWQSAVRGWVARYRKEHGKKGKPKGYANPEDFY